MCSRPGELPLPLGIDPHHLSEGAHLGPRCVLGRGLDVRSVQEKYDVLSGACSPPTDLSRACHRSDLIPNRCE